MKRPHVCSYGPRTFKMADPLTPADDLADHGVLDILFGDLLRAFEFQRSIQSNDCENVAVTSMTQGCSGTNIRRVPQVGNESPTSIGPSGLGIVVPGFDIRRNRSRCRWWDGPEKAVVDDQERDWQVDIFANQHVFLDRLVAFRGTPAQVGQTAESVLRQASVVEKHFGARGATFDGLESHVGLGDVLEGWRVDDLARVMAADGIEQSAKQILEAMESDCHLGSDEMGAWVV